MSKSKKQTHNSLEWRKEDGDTKPDKPSPMPMVSPKNFHKSSERLDVMNSVEKREIAEDVRKEKSKYDIRLKVFRQITSYKKWPLQELAFQDLDILMDAHLKGHLLEIPTTDTTPINNLNTANDPTQHGQGTKEWEDASHTSQLSIQSVEEPKRPRSIYKDTDTSSSPNKLQKEKYRKEFEAEVAIQPASSTGSDVPQPFLSPLWCMEPRIFAVEKSTTGKRYYVVTHLGRFMDHYWRVCDPSSRHYYEVIRENTPCRLYFDLEYVKSYNPTLTDERGEVLLEEFISELHVEVKQRCNLDITRENILDLDSSTDKKFSRHLIVHFPQGRLFSNTSSCGRFVKSFIGRLAEEVATGELSCRHPTLYQYLFVWKEEHEPSLSSEESTVVCPNENDGMSQPFIDKKKTCFVDLGVYTKNRLFRILGSCKYGKPVTAALRIASSNTFPIPRINLTQAKDKVNEYVSEQPSNEVGILDRKQMAIRRIQDTNDWEDHGRVLADSLVVPPNYSKLLLELLPDLDENSVSHSNRQGVSTSVKISQNTSCGPSTYPCLDNFVQTSLATRGGVSGAIRAWAISSGQNNETSTGIITYHMKDNRWCEYIGRAHKGNNIMWHISLRDMNYWQTCHDPDCRRAGFRGEVKALPMDVQGQLNDVILAKAIECDVEFEKALMALSISRDSVERNENDGDKTNSYQSNHSELQTEPASVNLSAGDANVGRDDAERHATTDSEPAYLVDSSFEEALVNFITVNPDLCP